MENLEKLRTSVRELAESYTMCLARSASNPVDWDTTALIDQRRALRELVFAIDLAEALSEGDFAAVHKVIAADGGGFSGGGASGGW